VKLKFLVAAIIATIVTTTLVIYLVVLNQEAEIRSILANWSLEVKIE